MPIKTDQELWTILALREKRLINAGWFLHFFLYASTAALICFDIALYVNGTSFSQSPSFALPLFLLALLSAAAFSYYLACSRFISLTESLIRLDEKSGSKGLLLAAIYGRSAWPTYKRPETTYRINLQNYRFELCGLAFALVIAFLVPSYSNARKTPPGAPPLEWGQQTQALHALLKTQPENEQNIRDLQRELENLKEQNSSDWYSLESLEATETLQEKIDDMQRPAQSGKLHSQESRQLKSPPDSNSTSLEESLNQAMRNTDSARERTHSSGEVDQQLPGQLRPGESHGEKGENSSKKGHGESQSGNSRSGQQGGSTSSGSRPSSDSGSTPKTGDGAGINRGPGTQPLQFGQRKRVLEAGKRHYLTHKESKGIADSKLGSGFSSRNDGSGQNASPPAGAGLTPGTGKTHGSWTYSFTPGEQQVVKKFYSPGS